MSKTIEHICKNCRLFAPKEQICTVTVLAEGQKYNLPVSPYDSCHMESLGIEVQQVRFWCENPETGEKAEKGIVKIEYPVGFFGKESNNGNV